jgi:hypothetical protein
VVAATRPLTRSTTGSARWTRDPIVVAEYLVDGIVQHLLREQCAGPDRGADQRIGDEQHHGAGGTLELSDGCTRTTRLCVSCQVDVSLDGDRGRGTGQRVVRMHLAVCDMEIAGDIVEGETLAEDVAEVERNAARQ